MYNYSKLKFQTSKRLNIGFLNFISRLPPSCYTKVADMDFLDPKKKRAHNIRLALGYLLMTVVLAIGTYFLVYQANGYNVDPKTGKIIQTGLVFVDGHPVPSTVYVNGQQKGQTDTRLILPAGHYSLELKRDGYRSWQRQFDVTGSSITRFAYPFLFPQNLITKNLQQYKSSTGLASETPDRHWLLVQQPNSLTDFDMVDLNTKTNPITPLKLPADLFTANTRNNSLEFVEWTTDNRHMLIKHAYDGGSEFVVIDRETPAASINVNRLFQVPISDMTLRDKKFDQYYLHNTNGGVLWRADAKANQLTPILTHVAIFKPYQANVILYVSDETAASGKVMAKIWDNETIYNLREIPTSKTYLIDLTQFNGTWYMAVGEDSDQKTYIYKDPFADLQRVPAKTPWAHSVLIVKSPQFIGFSANARFIEVQGGSEFAVYDAENNEQFRYDIKQPLPQAQKANWMDGHRLILISNNKTVVFDFDGTNMQTLNPADPGYEVFFDRDFTWLFTIAPGKTALTRTELRVPPTQ